VAAARRQLGARPRAHVSSPSSSTATRCDDGLCSAGRQRYLLTWYLGLGVYVSWRLRVPSACPDRSAQAAIAFA
jgi:hypothetical protein